MNNIHVCSFAASVGRLTPKERKDKLCILRALAEDPRISVWDMDEGRPRLWRTIYRMVDEGLIVGIYASFPWHKYNLTDKGKAMLTAEQQRTNPFVLTRDDIVITDNRDKCSTH